MKYKHLILGGTGHVGNALANALLARYDSVLMIGHSADKAVEWTQKGAAYEVADVLDSDRLHYLFGLGSRLFILNPPAPPSTDTVAEETKSVRSILTALQGTHLEKIVAASTYGAQPGSDIGDLGVLYQLEQELDKRHTPLAVIRSAYYMSNWDMDIDAVKKDGVLVPLYPANFRLPTVAPQDIGAFAAELMTNDATGLFFAEGPERYSPNDVAAAIGNALNKPATVNSVPEEQWQPFLMQAGFSPEAAGYMANMTRITMNTDFGVENVHRGKTTLGAYIKSSIANRKV